MTAKFRSWVKPVSSLVIGGMLLQCLSFACLACINAEAQSEAAMSCCPSQHKTTSEETDDFAKQSDCHDEIDYCGQSVQATIDVDLDKGISQILKMDDLAASADIFYSDKNLNQLAFQNLLSHHSTTPIYLSCCSFLE